MALQGSGAISLGDVQTEFGGSNPISISEYYGVDTGVPGSGTISLSDFYGTSNVDVTPDAITWGTLGPGSGVSLSPTFTGINQTITVNLNPVIIEGTLDYRINSGTWIQFSTSTDISISNNDTLQFQYNAPRESGSFGLNGTFNVTNVSDSNTILQTVSVSRYT